MKTLTTAFLAITLAATPLVLDQSFNAQAQGGSAFSGQDKPATPAPPTTQDKPAMPPETQPSPATQDKPAGPAAPDKAGAPDTRINGKWHFVFDTSGGDRDFEAEFTVDNEGKVTGTWDKSPATGTYKDGHLVMAFETHSEEAGETAQLQLDGKMGEASTITGSWAFASYDGTFKATRPKP